LVSRTEIPCCLRETFLQRTLATIHRMLGEMTMKALLTACAAIACAVTQVSLLECGRDDAASFGQSCEQGSAISSRALRAGTGAAAARSAGALASPGAPGGDRP
jgi:hypothetical protein